ncbi:hypothetical protein J2T24_000006 [Pseudarthrobacter niigatensis]|nr:hypothetical protein [Pseudarthrobacter niigatensis]
MIYHGNYQIDMLKSPPHQPVGRAFEQADLALRVLLSLAGLLETGLLTLDDTGVA